jgi:hypothetical protein
MTCSEPVSAAEVRYAGTWVLRTNTAFASAEVALQ